MYCIKLKVSQMFCFVIHSTNSYFHIFLGKLLRVGHSRSDCKRLSTMMYHFYFKNSEPVYETEYMQSLKQFAVQEVFPAYVLKRKQCRP